MVSLSKIASAFHRAEVTTRDVQAVRRGRVPQRVVNRVTGKAVGRIMRRVWR